MPCGNSGLDVKSCTDDSTLTILLADDDPFLREALLSSLRACGFRVMEADSGDSALPILWSGGFDVLVTDISMPGELDGWALADRALAVHPDIAVVYISSGPENAARRIARSLYLRKPFHPDAVAGAVRQLAGERNGNSPAEV